MAESGKTSSRDRRADARRRLERDLGQLERREDSAESFWRALSVLGTVGWSIALPAAAGAWLGHRLDLRFETGVRMTLILLCVGLTLGGFVAWRLVREHRS